MEETINFEKMAKKLSKYLDEDRMWHTLGVMHTASALAMRYGAPMEKAQLAGLLHDCAKCIPGKKQIKLCEKYGLPVSALERNHPSLLHAKLGAWIARTKYDVRDGDVLEAIRWHTTGKPGMSELEKIIYIADYIEPARNRAPRLPQIRRIAFSDLDRCMYEILYDTLQFLGNDSEYVDDASRRAFEYYKELTDVR